MGIVKEESSFELVEEGMYPVEVVDVMKERQYNSFRITFEILEGEYEGETVLGWVQRVLKDGWKLDRWLKALGIELEIGEEFEIEDILGSQATAQVIVHEKDDGSVLNKVEDLEKLKKNYSKKTKSRRSKKKTVKKREKKKKEAPKTEDGPFSADEEEDLDDIDW